RQAAADRYSYLACLPFAVLFGLALERLRPRFAIAVLSLVSTLSAAAAIRQSSYWRDDVSLWTRAAAVEPDSYLPRANLSRALLAAGRGEAAVPALEASIRLESRDVEARVNLGLVLAARGDLAGAERLYREALSLRPDDAPAAVNLATVRARAGDRAGAVRLLEGVLARDPSSAAARVNLGILKRR
ncbi:MAG: tetratricopeptide repeat protein, partial [Elusimicrobia bacterium]|nr:tetratricopeptide repeat protein [Elusimicrobiota bacterium]